MVGKEQLHFIQEASNLERWSTDISKTIFHTQGSWKVLKGKSWVKGGRLCVGEEGAQAIRLVLGRHDPEQICWHR